MSAAFATAASAHGSVAMNALEPRPSVRCSGTFRARRATAISRASWLKRRTNELNSV